MPRPSRPPRPELLALVRLLADDPDMGDNAACRRVLRDHGVFPVAGELDGARALVRSAGRHRYHGRKRRTIEAAWAAFPGSVPEEIAAVASLALGEPIGRTSVSRFRPAGTKRRYTPDPALVSAVAALWHEEPAARLADVVDRLSEQHGISACLTTVRKYRPAGLPPLPRGKYKPGGRARPEAARAAARREVAGRVLSEADGGRCPSDPTEGEIAAAAAEIRRAHLAARFGAAAVAAADGD